MSQDISYNTYQSLPTECHQSISSPHLQKSFSQFLWQYYIFSATDILKYMSPYNRFHHLSKKFQRERDK